MAKENKSKYAVMGVLVSALALAMISRNSWSAAPTISGARATGRFTLF